MPQKYRQKEPSRAAKMGKAVKEEFRMPGWQGRDNQNWGKNTVEKGGKTYRRLKKLQWSDKQIRKLRESDSRLILRESYEPRGWGSFQRRIGRETRRRRRISKEKAKRAGEAVVKLRKAVAKAPAAVARVGIKIAKKPFEWKTGRGVQDSLQKQRTRKKIVRRSLDDFDKLNVARKDRLLDTLNKEEVDIGTSSDPVEGRERLYGDSADDHKKLRDKLKAWNLSGRVSQVRKESIVLGPLDQMTTKFKGYREGKRQERERDEKIKAKREQTVSEREPTWKEGVSSDFAAWEKKMKKSDKETDFKEKQSEEGNDIDKKDGEAVTFERASPGRTWYGWKKQPKKEYVESEHDKFMRANY